MSQPALPVSTAAMNLAGFLSKAARRYPDCPALVVGEHALSWKGLDARVTRLAVCLSSKGVGKGDAVMTHSPNCPEMAEAMLACFRLGAIWVPTNYRLTPPEVAYLAENAGIRAMIVAAGCAAHVAAVTAVVGDIPVLAMGDAYEAALDAAPVTPVPNCPVNRDDPCWYFFTSGTTGRPKAAVLTHGQMGFVLTNHLADLMPGLSAERDASLVIAPLSHGAGIHFLVQVARGVVSVLPEGAGFDPEQIWQLVARHRISNMFTVPTILNRLVAHEAVARHDHGSLRHVIYAGAPMYLADQRRALDTLGPVLVQYYGLGEVTGCITVLRPEDHGAGHLPHQGSVGQARSGVEIAAMDDAGTVLGPGETGELAVRGNAVFAGYLHNPKANAAAFQDGWFRTGDMGHLDAAGFVYLTGRASDMYVSGGSNVYPREIEEAALTCAGIKAVAVIGVPDADWGEVGWMICVGDGDAPALMDHLAARLARYKLPKRVLFWDELPTSAYGKVTKALIRERLVQEGELAT